MRETLWILFSAALIFGTIYIFILLIARNSYVEPKDRNIFDKITNVFLNMLYIAAAIGFISMLGKCTTGSNNQPDDNCYYRVGCM